jgi:hypothetical protein
MGEMTLHPTHILKRRENKEGGGVLLWNWPHFHFSLLDQSHFLPWHRQHLVKKESSSVSVNNDSDVVYGQTTLPDARWYFATASITSEKVWLQIAVKKGKWMQCPTPQTETAPTVICYLQD